MKTLQANMVDVVRKKTYPARIAFDSHIRQIELLNERIDNRYILPGFVDAHVHIESSMLPPSEFARIAVRHGTLAAVSDPHEIANVLGIAGIDFMLADSARVPFRFVFGAPSCVPATPFESAGAVLASGDMEDLLSNEKIGYLSEMMNFSGVLQNDPEVMAKIAVARKYGKPIDGHAPGLTGDALKKYVEAGISTDHECTAFEEAEEKILAGMKILIREGSAAKNFDALYPLIEKYPDRVMLCTDDIHPDDLLRGHINTLITRAIAKGIDLFSVLRAATLNPVEHYRIDLGLLQLNDPADFIVVDNLRHFNVQQCFLRGECIDACRHSALDAESPGNIGGLRVKSAMTDREFAMTDQKPATTVFPNRFGASKISASDIQVIATSGKMKVIQVFDGDLFTKQFFCDVPKGLSVVSDTDSDILKMVVLNRYQPAKPAVAFIRGFGLKQGALASTVAHDSHHIVAVGADDESLVAVINHIIDLKGGLATWYDQHLQRLKLDIAGLMSSAPVEDVAHACHQLTRIASQMGSSLTAPFITLSFMALLVIPELKLGDKGSFDVGKFEWTELF